MDPKKLEVAVAHMRANWDKITADESAYKPGIADRLKPIFEAAARQEIGWDVELKKARSTFANQVGWRVADAFVAFANAYPEAVGRAIASLEGPADADRFWETALEPLGGREGLRSGFAPLYAPGARASIVSLVLFSRDVNSYPVYRPNISARPLGALLGEPVDDRTLSTRLVTYYAGLVRLGRLLRQRDLDVRSNLDVQGVLWVVNYSNVV